METTKIITTNPENFDLFPLQIKVKHVVQQVLKEDFDVTAMCELDLDTICESMCEKLRDASYDYLLWNMEYCPDCNKYYFHGIFNDHICKA
jgi:hypothetical protein